MKLIRLRVLLVAVLVTTLVACSSRAQRGPESVSTTEPVALRATFEPVAHVLRHSRCLNCHTVSDYPRQGDDRHPHRFLVARGPDDRGAYGERCNECHQGQNQANGVPGAQGWRLAPLTMAWESEPGTALSTASLCRRLLDPSRNGNRTLAQLEQHLRTEPLVLWAWSGGRTIEGTAREPPPLTHEEFLRAFQVWRAAGAPCPE
jgi:hypothetical protein